MAFDDKTRGRLQRFVTEARSGLAGEFAKQFQQDYGLDPQSGTVASLDSLAHLDDRRLETARILREILHHYLASSMERGEEARKVALDRMVREQAFTTLNRLAALRMMEARGLLIESVAKAYQSKAFQLYQRVAGTALGETGDAYRVFLLSLFDLYGAELPALFDRYAPTGRLFPREPTLLGLLDLINATDIEPLWGEDETIGWIYQYFNSKEERKAMRDASEAPRNSRELAVRNQFFTPRYVVEFLVDNTLARLWFNWTGGQTSLRDRCPYLLVKPGEKPEPAFRLRDPRTIKLLDPACGSMHFGLYAFDLFQEIYSEAWTWEQTHGSGCLDTEIGGGPDLKPLSQTYLDREAFLQDVPRLIIEHNIYGVDIDARAAQIASLALWLRAERAWHDANVKAKDRPQIGRGHVVAAVAPPAELELRKQFMEELNPLDAELFEQTLFMLKGLPELGVLLQVEKELPALIRKVFGEHGDLFRADDMAQWQKGEARLREALTDYARAARSTYQGRLFAEDALCGLRMIDLCRETYDVVVMNPPFGQPTDVVCEYLKSRDSDGWKDIYAGFFERAITLKRKGGLVGAITSSQFFHTRQMKKLRDDMIVKERLLAIVDLGKDVLDGAAVQTALTVLSDPQKNAVMAYADLFEIESKDYELLGRISGRSMQYLPLKDIAAIPGRPLCLHASPKILHQWSLDRPLDPNTATVATGNHTFDDERFLRIFPEFVSSAGDWSQYEKGGEFQPFFSPSSIFVRWSKSGAQLRAINIAAYGGDSQVMQASTHWGKIGICFNHVSSVGFSPRILPKGTMFSSESISIFLRDDGGADDDAFRARYLALLGFLCSTVAQELVYVFGRFRKIENRAVSGIPISFSRLEREQDKLASAALKGISISRHLSSFDETSSCFILPERIDRLLFDGATRASLKQNAEELYNHLDEICHRIVGVSDDDILAERRSKLVSQFSLLRANHSEQDLNDEVLSWAAGVAFGRFDWRLATGERNAPPEPDPFDPLSTKSPGMLADGAAPFHSHHGILVDDQGHPHDLPQVIEEVLARLDVEVPGDVRRWLQRDFFPLHLKQYSESRRKAPIYWPFSIASGSYTLWLYYPSLTSQTLYSAVNDFIEGPNGKLRQLGRELSVLRDKGIARSRDDEKAFEMLQTLEFELIELRDLLLQIAPTFHPNQDDGVQITAAPLWELFRHKPWQKVLKDTWAKLKKGDYDWAHLAMAYWPERVREKCKTDKSLAIAHDLEHLYVEPEPKARGRKNISA
ncbi:BREX-1 system adenine-specific DNA-methyltransferase PglX [Mesorhizobium sp. B2-4-8]|uniref:BREX-1 system adenine-specific DNA-methyltransferase PglX n=1 Tax=Mesorhizobium sp. B2-4-8 TaxID=2589941 RepID=UPI001126B5C6|nr:BREX-1 system adenine-specific DNA-methyltransferase PglX [Mesorhizobium sp. B2-4-8]TPL29533.1 BREX-1 system adenine-specific DNA-methyltransferase PglX [Mesorhizobium sp. B2-4-8]